MNDTHPDVPEKTGGSGLRALITVATASVLASLDLFVVNLAFSSISASFPGASVQALSWVLNAYGVAFAALLVPAGRLADRFGRRRLFRLGLVVFAAGSAGAAFAPDVATLIIARAIQGGGAALLVPTSLALLLAAYPKVKHKHMVAIWAASGSVAAAAGPVLGGLLTQFSWRWIFLINLPIALPAFFMAAKLVETHRERTKIPDLFGSALLVVGASLLITAISYANEWGFASPRLAVFLVISAIALGWFIRRCETQPAPPINLSVFQIPSFTIATVGMACFYAGFAIVLLGGSLFVTRVWAWSPVRAGLGFVLGPMTGFVAALIAGKSGVAPRRLAVLGGGLLFAAGMYWYSNLAGASGFGFVFLPGLMLVGAAAGTAQTGFIASGASELPAHEYATGTGILNTARQFGGAVGVAILIAIVGAGREAANYRAAWAVIAVAGLVSATSGLLLRPKPQVSNVPLPMPVID